MLDYMGIMLNARLARMDERGASAVEYALMVCGVILVLAVAAPALFGTLKAVFMHEQDKLTSTP